METLNTASVVARLTDSKPPSLPIPALRVICAWCPGFTPTSADKGASHGICPACAAKIAAELDAKAVA